MTPDSLDEIRARHEAARVEAIRAAADPEASWNLDPHMEKRQSGTCSRCGAPWPCEVARLIDVLDALLADRDKLRGEVERLRLVLAMMVAPPHPERGIPWKAWELRAMAEAALAPPNDSEPEGEGT